MDHDMRRIISFKCEGVTLAGTLDEGIEATGLLIVSGGNEIRIGAHRGMAELAQAIAGKGHPVFRFDRRGIGDSDGENGGFDTSGPDISAAIAAFRAECPQIRRIIAFGNCDAATALWLHQPLAIDALVLANPWLVESATESPAPATTRAYYARRLRDPRAWAGFFKGAVNLAALFGSLRTATQRNEPSSLAARVAHQLERFSQPTTILLAAHDGTAVAFKAQWGSDLFDRYRSDIKIISFESSSHSFAGDSDFALLVDALTTALAQ
jgi:exosortase A-associated hydrolase 1